MNNFRENNTFRDRTKKPRVLIESWSPVCDIQALAEESDTCVYFYLYHKPDEGKSQVKSCWVCNTVPAPDGVDKAAMDNGEAPRMPRSGCGHDPGGIHLDQGELSIVWLEEGDAAALLEKGKILALIPGWAWSHDFSGYARYAVGTTPFAWELTQAEAVLAARVERSADYWDNQMTDYWRDLQTRGLAAMEDFFGPHEKYFAIDGGKFPTKALVTGKKDGARYAFTLGVSALCQPLVEQYYKENAGAHRRIELAFAAREDFPEEAWMRMLGFVSGTTGFPWRVITWLGHGHTLRLTKGCLPGFAAVLLLDARELAGVSSPAFSPVMGEPVALLWLVPLTQGEYELATQSMEPVILEKYQGTPGELVVFDGEPKFLKE